MNHTGLFFLPLAAALLLTSCGDDDASPIPPAERAAQPDGAGRQAGAGLKAFDKLLKKPREGFRLGDYERTMLDAYRRTGDPNQATNGGYTLLHLACHYNCPELVQELIERGADVNAVSYSVFDYFELTDTCDVEHIAPLTAFYYAAMPCFYLRNATAENCNRIIDMLLAAGADPLLGDSPLPHVARIEYDHVHFEEVFVHLLDKGFTLEEERRHMEPPAALRERLEKQGLRLDSARISPAHREGTFSWLEYHRELGCPWTKAEERLGIKK